MAIIESLQLKPSLPAPTSVRTPAKPVHPRDEVHVPRYLRDVYTWAYLDPRNVRLLDREWIVDVILWAKIAVFAKPPSKTSSRGVRFCCRPRYTAISCPPWRGKPGPRDNST